MDDCVGRFLLKGRLLNNLQLDLQGRTQTSPSTTNETRVFFNAAKQTKMPPLLLGPLWTHGDSFCSEVRLGIFVCFRGFWRIRGRVDWLVSWWYEGRESLWRDTAPGISKVQRGTREWPWKARFCLETIIFRWSMSNLSGGKGRSRKDIGLTRKMWRSRQWWQPGNSAGALFGIVKFKGWNGDLQRWEIKRSRLDIIHRWHNLDSPLIVVPIPTTKSTFQAIFTDISQKMDPPTSPSAFPKGVTVFSGPLARTLGASFRSVNLRPMYLQLTVVETGRRSRAHKYRSVWIYKNSFFLWKKRFTT